MKYEISKFDPCEDALEFRKQYPTFKEAWENCSRGDWMLWIAKRLNVDLKILTKAKAKCALTVRHLMKDQRSIDACEIALRFADGLATRDELDAAYAASAAASAAAYAAAAYAASAAAYAASAAAASAASAAASAAAYAAAAYDADASAASAAYAAYDAAYDASAASPLPLLHIENKYAAKIKNQLETANICREVLTEIVFEKLNIKP